MFIVRKRERERDFKRKSEIENTGSFIYLACFFKLFVYKQKLVAGSLKILLKTQKTNLAFIFYS